MQTIIFRMESHLKEFKMDVVYLEKMHKSDKLNAQNESSNDLLKLTIRNIKLILINHCYKRFIYT